MKTTLDLDTMVTPDLVASRLSVKWVEWDKARSKWTEEKKELRNYLYATDTRTTTNSKLPWCNSTTTPKLTQIYDNLKANYSAAIFPNSNWMKWRGLDMESADAQKVKIIQGYMSNKIRISDFETVADRLIDDYILYGNCFATVEYETGYNEVGGEIIQGYVGPRIVRISPHDIVFDPTAASFEKSPKITRTLTSLGEVRKMIEAGDTTKQMIFDKMMSNRREVSSADRTTKSEAYVADGFSNIEQYYSSDYVELLTFWGDIYDIEANELKTNRKITIVDRAYVLSDEPIASWLGSAPIFHAGWRSRPDNLYAMGPLDNLVGMQYRIDHLENLKADVFDQIALPVLKVRGDVEDFDFGPGTRIYLGEEGDVAPMVPDATALNADLQIENLQNKMEEMAGAPRQAMGIRTPGEKTAFEVQTLQNAAGRIFQHKAAKFEKEFIEPVLNAMLESARRNMEKDDTIAFKDETLGATLFKTITREDITAKGRIIPMGARHFAERATRVQDLNKLLSVKNGDPSVGVHLSGKVIARIISEELNEPELFSENVAITEQNETQLAAQDEEAATAERLQVSAEEGL